MQHNAAVDAFDPLVAQIRDAVTLEQWYPGSAKSIRDFFETYKVTLLHVRPSLVLSRCWAVVDGLLLRICCLLLLLFLRVVCSCCCLLLLLLLEVIKRRGRSQQLLKQQQLS
jgi:hypothetical protein